MNKDLNNIKTNRAETLDANANPPLPSFELNNSRLDSLRDRTVIPDFTVTPTQSFSEQLARLPENYRAYPFERDFRGIGVIRPSDSPRYQELSFSEPELELFASSDPLQYSLIDHAYENEIFSFVLFTLFILTFFSVLIFLIVFVVTFYEKPIGAFLKIARLMYSIFNFYKDCQRQLLIFSEGAARLFPSLFSPQTRSHSFIAPFSARLRLNFDWLFSMTTAFFRFNPLGSGIGITSLFLHFCLFKRWQSFKKSKTYFFKRWLGR